MTPDTTDADRLRALFDARPKINKKQFAAEFGIPGGASMVSQHLSGNRPISMQAGVGYARGFGCSLKDISPRLAAEASQATGVLSEQHASSAVTTIPTRRSPGEELADALRVLGKALEVEMPQDVREDVAHALSNLARRQGALRDQLMVVHLLGGLKAEAEPTKRVA